MFRFIYSKAFLIFFILQIVVILFFFKQIDTSTDNQIEREESFLVSTADLHFQNQVNTRKWNANYGGVYVFPKNGMKPNNYLKNNSLDIKDGQHLIKINPAWMTRQLAELETIRDIEFKITSLDPINPINLPNEFEIKALNKIKNTKNLTSYYEFDSTLQKLDYFGALFTESSCMECHAHQGYRIGDLRGGIRVTIDAQKYFDTVDFLENKRSFLKNTIILASLAIACLFIIILLSANRLKVANRSLEEKVKDRTKELQKNNDILKNMLDSELNILVLTNGTRILDANSAFFEFFGYTSIEDFEKDYNCICDLFLKEHDENYVQKDNNGKNWVEYILQTDGKSKVLIKRDGKNYIFEVHAKQLSIKNNLYMMTFINIDDYENRLKNLQIEANTDSLTKLFNRSFFDREINQKILKARKNFEKLSVIFLDIDNFKKINDTFGHNKGDEVLIKLAEILKKSIRVSDFVARWGGEEFVVVLENDTVDSAMIVAEHIRKNVENATFSIGQKVTCSFGVSQLNDNQTLDELLKSADYALYLSKKNGKNMVSAG